MMRRMGIEAIYRRPRHVKAADRAQDLSRICCAGWTVVPAEPGVGDGHHLHPDGARLRLSGRCARLVQPSRAVVGRIDHHGGIDSASRRWRMLLARHGKPEIFNTDQGSQFTGSTFTGVLAGNGIAISMDGKGAWRTTCSSSVYGAASNTRKCICGPTKAIRGSHFDRPLPGVSIMARVHTRALTAPRPIKPTSPRCRSAWQPNPCRGSTYRRGKSCSDNRDHL